MLISHGGIAVMDDDDDWDPELEEFMAETPDEPSERDIGMAANQLIKTYGQNATVYAALQADKWLTQGDLDQYRLSKRILSALDELLTLMPPDSAKQN